MRQCLDYFVAWAKRIGMSNVRIDPAGNFRALLKGRGNKRLIIGSHLDTVRDAGAFDGILGVVMGMVIAESFSGAPPACTLEIVGFSEEEGVRFGCPFIGSVAFVDGLNDEFLATEDEDGVTIRQAIANFGLDARSLSAPQMHEASGFLEFHIEQGPLLDNLRLPLGVVESIAGQTRAKVEFIGKANHAGTTPMNLRRDAFCGAAEWTLLVERKAAECAGLVATVGTVQVLPGVGNVVPGAVVLSLDLRHPNDAVRLSALEELLRGAQDIAVRRNLSLRSELRLNHAAVPMNGAMVAHAEHALASTGLKVTRMTSGAGHDAMILAKRIPSVMIFVRSPGGVSHHPDEAVLIEDVGLALDAGQYFVESFV